MTRRAYEMPKLSPPGSFRLCADAAFEPEATGEIESLASLTRDMSRTLPASGLLLTGSFARGEGVIVRDRNGNSNWLSDVECLVVLPDDSRRDFAGISRQLADLARQLNEDARRQVRRIRIELSPILASRLAAMRPAIFTFELLQHGKLLWGQGSEVRMPRSFEPGGDLLRRDAFRLLNNRIMEQIAAEVDREPCSPQGPAAAYALSKFWVEMGTSVSVFLDCYRPSYRARQAALEEALAGPCDGLDDETASVLAARLAEGMGLKFGHITADEYPTDGGFESATHLASCIWWWESGRLLGDGVRAGDWRSVPARLRRVETTAARVRDWGRLLLRTGTAENLRASALGEVLRAGSFGSAIYAAGCLLYFFWEQIGSGRGPGREVSRTLGRLLGVDASSGPATRRMLAQRASRAWQTHLKAAAA
jgi:hypothetical protein